MKLNSYTPKWWYNKKIERELLFKSGKILLLALDDNYVIEKEGQKNLVAIDSENNIIWLAGLPTEVYDSYYDVWFDNGILYARSSNSFIAEINPETGKIIKSYMVK